MTALVLRFQHNPLTDLPHLIDETGTLRPDELASWEAELNRRCTAQTLRDGEVVTFPHLARDLPNRFRLRAVPGQNPRIPTYLLEPAPADPIWQPSLSDLSLWQSGFLAAAEQLAHETATDRLGRHGLGFVLDELRDLAREHPHDLLVVLLASYAAVGQLAVGPENTSCKREQFYACALDALNPRLRAAAPARPGRLNLLLGAVARCLGFSQRSN